MGKTGYFIADFLSGTLATHFSTEKTGKDTELSCKGLPSSAA
jgi:hypothetical protein